jgi:hypothetical protein
MSEAKFWEAVDGGTLSYSLNPLLEFILSIVLVSMF